MLIRADGLYLNEENKLKKNAMNTGVYKETDLKVPADHMIVGVRIPRNTDIMN